MDDVTAKLAEALRFCKKPVVIEAVQWDGTESGIQRIKARFPALETCGKTGHLKRDEVTHWRIRTLEGAHTVSKGDWVIKGVKGEFYPCKPDIFSMTYEPADEARAQPKQAAEPGMFPKPVSGTSEPVAWQYRGEPTFDGKEWHETIKVTTSEQVARFKDKDARPLFAAPVAQAEFICRKCGLRQEGEKHAPDF